MALDRRDHKLHGVESIRQQIDDGLRRGVVRHRVDGDAGKRLEALQRQMHLAAQPLDAERNLARIGLGIGDEFGDRLHPQARPHNEQNRLIDTDRYRPEVARWLKIHLLREMLGDHDRTRRGEQQRVAVGRGLGDLRGTDPGASAGLVLDDEALSEKRLCRRGRDPRGGIDAGAGSDRHDHADRPVRIVGCVLGVDRHNERQ